MVDACDCSGFVCWALGSGRQEADGAWINTDAIWEDAKGRQRNFQLLAQARPGALVVYPKAGSHENFGHVGIVIEAEAQGRATLVAHCSADNFGTAPYDDQDHGCTQVRGPGGEHLRVVPGSEVRVRVGRREFDASGASPAETFTPFSAHRTVGCCSHPISMNSAWRPSPAGDMSSRAPRAARAGDCAVRYSGPALTRPSGSLAGSCRYPSSKGQSPRCLLHPCAACRPGPRHA